MEVLSTTNVSHQGNDAYIEESYSLINQFGVYAVIRIYRVSGWSSQEEVSVIIASTNDTEVRSKYKELCRFYKG
jgi:hypothetical protein